MEGVVASRNYNPGDVIYCEPAFVKAVSHKDVNVVCEFCRKMPVSLKACKECLTVKYCGKECQKKDWSSHKWECKHLKNLTKGVARDFVRLLGKIILKIKDKDWKLIKRTVFGKEFSFDDINSHSKEMMENPRRILFFNEVKELTGNFIGFENLPDDENLKKVIGKVVFGNILLGFYIGLNMFDRECIPNSNVTICGNGIKIWACKKIKKGLDKITLPMRTMLLPPEKFGSVSSFSCKCADCSLPYGESVLFKIIDEKRAYSMICATEAFLDAVGACKNLVLLPEYQQVADRLLREQEGVLGDTNGLRMELLAVRCLNMRGNPHEIRRLLLKLEASMSSAFGEYYIELLPIYKLLFALSFELWYPSEMVEYMRKMQLIEHHLV